MPGKPASRQGDAIAHGLIVQGSARRRLGGTASGNATAPTGTAPKPRCRIREPNQRWNMERSLDAKIKVLIFPILLFALLIPMGLRAGGGMQLSDAIKTLNNAVRVESKRIGEEGMESVIFKAYVFIRSSENAKDVFEEILKSSTLKVDTVYALMWAFENDRALYDRYKDSFKQDTTIEVMIGDLLFSYSLDEIRNNIESTSLNSLLSMGRRKKSN
jgi:hypothetical protein